MTRHSGHGIQTLQARCLGLQPLVVFL